MRRDLFEALAPVCPRCLHAAAIEAPLILADVSEERDGRVWQGVLHCSAQDCWQEYPVVDGVPVLVPDPGSFLTNAHAHVLGRTDLGGAVASLIGDALGPGHVHDQTRQHLSLYAGSHFSDWSDPPGEAGLGPVLDAALEMMGPAGPGARIDLGCGTGRGTWSLAARGDVPTVGADLNFSMLRLAQTLALEGEARWERRRIGVVYDPATARLPDAMAALPVDFWAMDAMALPFPAGRFDAALAVNLVDCIPGPTNLIAETARVMAGDAPVVFTTPYDWSATVAEPAAWIGGHSQRGPTGGAGEPVLCETLRQYGLIPQNALDAVPWRLRMHARAVMEYSLHVVACRRAA